MDGADSFEPPEVVKLRKLFMQPRTCEWVPTKSKFYEIFMGRYKLDRDGKQIGVRLVLFMGERLAHDITLYPEEFVSIIEKYNEFRKAGWIMRHDKEAVQERNRTGGFKKLEGGEN